MSDRWREYCKADDVTCQKRSMGEKATPRSKQRWSSSGYAWRARSLRSSMNSLNVVCRYTRTCRFGFPTDSDPTWENVKWLRGRMQAHCRESQQDKTTPSKAGAGGERGSVQ